MTRPEYKNLVANVWNMEIDSAIMKLIHIKDKSFIFGKEVFGKKFKMKGEIEGIINGVNIQLDICPSSYLIRLEKDLQHQ